MSIANELAKQALAEYNAMNKSMEQVLHALNNITKARNSKDVDEIKFWEGVGVVRAKQLANHRVELGRLLREIVKA